jgi:hypothetical protein
MPVGRLLEHLQQGVLRLLVRAVGSVDEDHAAIGDDGGAGGAEEPTPGRGDDALPRRPGVPPRLGRSAHKVRVRA